MNAKDLNQNAQLTSEERLRIAKAVAPHVLAKQKMLKKHGLSSLSFWK
jgi:hypothetical protein